jgi:ATP phosphoribosyltransferase regulatory subunit
LEKDIKKKEWPLSLVLAELYASYGYKKYKMSRFEEYSLYTDNEDFLASKDIITFSGRDGRLLALRPDVTLSIVKNSNASNNNTEKLYYNENVYRLSKGSSEFKEISQMGAELLGKIDICAISEITLLILKSLNAVTSNFILAISNINFITGLIDSFNIKNSAIKDKLFELLRLKNMHDFDKISKKANLSSENIDKFKKLISISGNFEKALVEAKALIVNEKMQNSYDELQELYNVLKDNSLSAKMQLDFSIVNNESYYNGIIYNGYIENMPKAILVGGQYDKLMQKFGNESGALGFALHYGEFSDYSDNGKVDILVKYDNTCDTASLMKEVEKLRNGLSVRVCDSIPLSIKYKKLMTMQNGKLVEVKL